MYTCSTIAVLADTDIRLIVETQPVSVRICIILYAGTLLQLSIKLYTNIFQKQNSVNCSFVT